MADKDEHLFWLKLKKDFFKRHDIRVLKAMPNGTEYALFYLELLCESLDHNGELRFSDTIPYNEEMLGTITDTNIDVVRSAMKIFQQLGMVEILDDKTIFMTELNSMLGKSTKWAEIKAKQRERIELNSIKLDNVQSMSKICPTEREKEIELDIDTDKKENYIKEKSEKSNKRFVKPTIEEIRDYIDSQSYNVNPSSFFDFYESKGWKVGNQPMKDWKASVRLWNRTAKTGQTKGKQLPNGRQRHYTDEEYKSMFTDLDNMEW